MKTMKVIGLMSGTSLDGLDIAYIEFNFDTDEEILNYHIIHSKSHPYSIDFIQELEHSTQIPVVSFLQLDKKIGHVFGQLVNSFVSEFNIDTNDVNCIASHGQTTFHQPEKGFTSQIGCGDTIAILTGIPVVNDFRTKDVILGGQGAPLVPIGDFKLFNKEAQSFLNLGVIANISFKKENKIIAFDICPANLPLNSLTKKHFNLDYDQNGDLAKSGEVNWELYTKLNELNFYSESYPKSLGTEWLEENFNPLIHSSKQAPLNLLSTIIEHEAYQISKILNDHHLDSVFITGGGAFNHFMIERLKFHYKGKVIIPNSTIIEFKEALVFGFLGALYLNKKENLLCSVTGASRDSIGGVLHLP